MSIRRLLEDINLLSTAFFTTMHFAPSHSGEPIAPCKLPFDVLG